MQRYSLAELGREAGRRRGTTTRLTGIHARHSAEIAYYRALRVMLDGMSREVRDSIIPAYEADMRLRVVSDMVRDADQSWFERLRQTTANILARVAASTVERILSLEGQRHTKEFSASVKRTLGIDLAAVVREEDIANLLRDAVGRNVSLITGLADDTVKRIAQKVYDSSIAGNSATTLRKLLREEFAMSDRRARLIARDQMASFNADLTELRDRQAGIEKYEWSTSADERVRERHRGLEGKVYAWGEPTGAEGGLPPGKPILCRCVALAVVEF